MPNTTNLDAMLRREDFEARAPHMQKSELVPSFKILELESGSLFQSMLRKPDFQRTTAHWTPEKVAQFIRSFVEGDLIPAIIVWRSPTSGNLLVIDGAHRMSALIAWVHDDYGDRAISVPFFENAIPPEQRRAADLTRELVRKGVGPYVEIKAALSPSSHATAEKKTYAQNIAGGGIKLQEVPGDAARAERSFHIINGQQTPISDTELRLIRDRKCPNAIATRALIRAGTGEDYVTPTVTQANREAIRALARAAYDDLFVPPLETPIKTLDLPVAGRGYSAETVRLILDLVEFTNRRQTGAPPPRLGRIPKAAAHEPTMDKDPDGSATVAYLREVRRATSRIAGNQPRSLGLHPAVYFYSATGNYQPAAFLAAIGFVERLDGDGKLDEFTETRSDFEELLLRQKYCINEIVKKLGAGIRSVAAMIKFFEHLYTGARSGRPDDQIMGRQPEATGLDFLWPLIDDAKTKKVFTSERKSAVFLRSAIEGAVRCGICRARVHRVSSTVDHIERQEDGGRGDIENGQVAHPYCNTGYKEGRLARGEA